MVLQGDEARVEYLVSVNLEIVQILMQDRCMVCTERTIGSEIILDAPDGTPRMTWVMSNLVSVRLERC